MQQIAREAHFYRNHEAITINSSNHLNAVVNEKSEQFEQKLRKIREMIIKETNKNLLKS